MRATATGELGIGIACEAGPRPPGYDFLELAPDPDIDAIRRSGGRCGVLDSAWLSVGGSCEPDPALLALLAENVALRRPAYVVERLGFNRFSAGQRPRATGFVLPAPQTPAGVAVAASRIVSLRERLGTPVAFEIGPRYLSARRDELPDSVFHAAIAHHADCGIVVDLANVPADRKNGRDSATILDGLPLERIWEVRIPGAAAADVRRLAERIVPRLPALRALSFAVRPEAMRGFGARALDEQRDWLADLWTARGTETSAGVVVHAPALPSFADARARVGAWERSIVAGIAGIAAGGEDAEFALLANLVATARKAAIARGAELSLRLLEATLGRPAFADLLARYCAQTAAQAFAATEALRFLQFVECERTDVPYLREVVAFERAAAAALHGAGETAIYFSCEPTEIFRALLRHDRPYVSDRRPHVVHVGPRGIRIESNFQQAG